jgi:HlyD family secretion protein
VSASKHIKLWTTLVLLLFFIAALIFWLKRSKPVSVIIKNVEYGQVQDTVANTRVGTIRACRRAGISPSIGGQISSLPVKEGDKVKANQVLMELWNEDRLAEVALATREAKAAKARSRQACVLAQVARREAQRLFKLKLKGLAAEEAVDQAEGDANAQQAACNAALASAEVSDAKIDVASAALDRTRLKAPFEGIVAEINGEVGEFVTPSPVGIPTPPAVNLVDITCLYVLAPIDEVDAPQIRVGMPARVSLDAYPDRVFDGRVRRVAPYVLDIEKQARTLDVEVDFIDKADTQDMLPGYSADIEVTLAQRDRTLRIPTEAILEGNKVLLFGDDGLLEERAIEIGLSNWAWTEVNAGMEIADEVVVSVNREGVEEGVTAVRQILVEGDD